MTHAEPEKRRRTRPTRSALAGRATTAGGLLRESSITPTKTPPGVPPKPIEDPPARPARPTPPVEDPRPARPPKHTASM